MWIIERRIRIILHSATISADSATRLHCSSCWATMTANRCATGMAPPTTLLHGQPIFARNCYPTLRPMVSTPATVNHSNTSASWRIIMLGNGVTACLSLWIPSGLPNAPAARETTGTGRWAKPNTIGWPVRWRIQKTNISSSSYITL